MNDFDFDEDDEAEVARLLAKYRDARARHRSARSIEGSSQSTPPEDADARALDLVETAVELAEVLDAKFQALQETLAAGRDAQETAEEYEAKEAEVVTSGKRLSDVVHRLTR